MVSSGAEYEIKVGIFYVWLWRKLCFEHFAFYDNRFMQAEKYGVANVEN